MAKQKQDKQAKEPKDQGQAPARKIGPDLKAIHATAIMAVQAQQVIGAAAQVKQGGKSISQHLLGSARTFPNMESFKQECGRQELWLKSDEGINEINRLHPELNYHGGKTPACWVQAKSNIIKTWGNEQEIGKAVPGFTLKACTTESAMRKALNTWRKMSAAKPSMVAVERLGNVVRSLERAKREGNKDATNAVTAVTSDVLDLLDTYAKILEKVLPAKPEKAAVKKAA